MRKETTQERSERILRSLKNEFPGVECYDLDGRGLHFVCETEPVSEHPAYDAAVEVIIESKPHKHIKMTQRYTVLSGELELHIDDETVFLSKGDSYVITSNQVHWAKSNNEAKVELYSVPGWTKEDHIAV
jgi:mannose-6-phosphate isomerase-like protein (cupin superfamily)